MKRESFMKDALILFAITLISGICLGGVYELTKGPIERSKMAAREGAYKLVYESADSFAPAEELGEHVAVSENNLSGSGFGSVLVDDIVKALDASGNEIGYVVTSSSKDGYGGLVTITVGVAADGTVQGIEFLSLTETAGLGMNANTPEFKGQFSGKKVDAFMVVKGGASADHEIDALGGATITSNAVANAVNAAISTVRTIQGQ